MHLLEIPLHWLASLIDLPSPLRLTLTILFWHAFLLINFVDLSYCENIEKQ